MKRETPGLTKYTIGLGIILLFTLGLAGWLVLQASTVKADTKTYQAAQKIASDLEAYIDTNYTIPSQLSEATKRPVPAEITYKTLSGGRYQFCVTYQATSSGFDASEVQAEVLSRAYGTAMPDGTTGQSQEQMYLYVSPNHTAGKNCQTIDPQLMTINDGSSGGGIFGSDCKYDSTKPNGIEDYYNCLDKSGTGAADSTHSI